MKENLGSPIANGRTAEIFAWHNETVLKLFYDWVELDDINYELRIARTIQSSGLPVPFADKIIQVNGRNGLIYQRIDGITMLEMMTRKPWRGLYYARRMAEHHAMMHAGTIQMNLPPLRKKILNKINQAKALPADLRQKTLNLLEKMPEGNRLCHGDYHPNNILLTKQGEVIIDWSDAALGNPMADLARTTIISIGAISTDQIKNPFLKIFIRIFHSMYIQRYFSIHPGGKSEYSLWLPIVAAARLSENIPEIEKWLIGQTEKGLAKVN